MNRTEEDSLQYLQQVFDPKFIPFYEEKLTGTNADQSDIDLYIEYFGKFVEILNAKTQIEEAFKRCVDARYAHYEKQQVAKCDSISNNITTLEEKLEEYKVRSIKFEEVMYIAGLINEIELLNKQLEARKEFDTIISSRTATKEICEKFDIENFEFQDTKLVNQTHTAFLDCKKLIDYPIDTEEKLQQFRIFLSEKAKYYVKLPYYNHNGYPYEIGISTPFYKLFTDFCNIFDTPSNLFCEDCKIRVKVYTPSEQSKLRWTWPHKQCNRCSDCYKIWFNRVHSRYVSDGLVWGGRDFQSD